MEKMYVIILFYFFGLFSLIAQPSAAKSLEFKPSEVGISSERLQLIDRHIESFIADGSIPGGVFLLARKGKIVYNKSFGNKDLTQPYQNDDIFRLASMTKAFTTVSIMQLFENGKLGLDDPISYYIPEFKDAVVAENLSQVDSSYTTRPVQKPITIRHLLTHTSGITYGVFQRGAIQAMYEKFNANGFGLSHESINTVDMAKTIAKVPLIFEPGEKYSYGLNMEVLGAIVEIISGLPFNEYIHKNILDPLGLKDTDFYFPKNYHDRIVPVYTFDENRKIILSEDKNANYPKEIGRNNFPGGGGMSGTAMDYYIFCQTLLNKGVYKGKRILSRKSIEVMTSDQLIIQNKNGTGFSKYPGITYGLGFQLKTEEAQAYSHKSPGTFEWGGYFNTKFFIDPAEELIFVGMTQVVPFYRQDFWEKFYAIIYSSIED